VSRLLAHGLGLFPLLGILRLARLVRSHQQAGTATPGLVQHLLRVIFCHIYLVGGFNHLEQYESQWLVDCPIYYGKLKKSETTNQCAYYYIMFSICLSSHNGPSYKKSGGRLGVWFWDVFHVFHFSCSLNDPMGAWAERMDSHFCL
jgi:hypothetical protein